MATATQKEQFLGGVQASMTAAAELNERTRALVEIFVQRGYDPGAADPITPSDLAPFGIIPYHMGNAINLCQAVANLCAGTATAANAAAPATLSFFRQAITAPTTTTKALHIGNVQVSLATLAELGERALVLATLFADRGYAVGGSDPITDTDLANYGVVVANLATAIVFLQAQSNLTEGVAVAANAAFPISLSKWRAV